MKILRRPLRLKLLALGLLLFPLFSLFEMGQLLPMPWTEPFSLSNSLWMKWETAFLIHFAVWMIILRGILNVSILALYAFHLVVFGSCFVIGVFSIIHKSPQLALTTFSGLLGGLAFSFALRREFTRSCFNHGRKWFQGKAKTIPHISARLLLSGEDEDQEKIQISSLTFDGFFGFLENTKKQPEGFLRGIIELEGRTIQFEGNVCSQISPEKIYPWTGFGVQFCHSPEQNMIIGDFIESLRSRGYAQNL